MNDLQLKIARFLAFKASRGLRTTYQQVGEAVDWHHPTGRGLGNNLEIILRELHARNLPPLTTILVKKGERHPPDDAMAYVHRVLGNIDIEQAQMSVFDFDWDTEPDINPRPEDFSSKANGRPEHSRLGPKRADSDSGNVFLLKFNGQNHGPDGISRPKSNDAWDGKVIRMPWEGPRASSKATKHRVR